MIKKFVISFLTFALSICKLAGIEAPSCVDFGNEKKLLEKFLRIGIEEEEYGYVLEGVKPISVRNFYGLSAFPISREIEREEDEFQKTLLVRGIGPIWNKFCSQQKNVVLKVLCLVPSEPLTSPLEVQFINVAKLREVIESNIDLFRYILGSTVQVESLIHKIVYSEKPLEDILQGNRVLMGIVLGFGSHNSLKGGRMDEIFSLSISKEHPPFLPKSYLMEDAEGNHSLSILLSKVYGYDYLEFAGGNHKLFSTVSSPSLKSLSNISNVKEELLTLDNLQDPLPSCLLTSSPLFIFGAYKGGPSNQPLFDQLKKAQGKAQLLLKEQNFLEQVLNKILEDHPPRMPADQTLSAYHTDLYNTLDSAQWKKVILLVMEQFKMKNEQDAFIQALADPLAPSKINLPMIGASKALLKGIEKALHNLDLANAQFKTFAEDAALETIFPNKLYFKVTQPGSGKRLQKNSCVRLGYIIENLQGEFLFANYDMWVSLSETVLGLAHGVQGMKRGEKRILFVHPAFGYGVLTTLPPCIGLKISVYLIDIDESSHDPFPLAQPLDLDWIKDSALYRKIQESVENRPCFVGSFYGRLLNRIENLDKAALVSEIKKQVSMSMCIECR